MMDHKIDRLISAIGDMNTAYLEEAIAFDGAKAGQTESRPPPKIIRRAGGSAGHTGPVRDSLCHQQDPTVVA